MANVPATEGITEGSGPEGRVKAFSKQALPNHAVLISLPPLHTAFYDLCICFLGNTKLARESDMNKKVERKAGTGWLCTECGFYCKDYMKPLKT